LHSALSFRASASASARASANSTQPTRAFSRPYFLEELKKLKLQRATADQELQQAKKYSRLREKQRAEPHSWAASQQRGAKKELLHLQKASQPPLGPRQQD
jgi:hypothetical protein